jgi:hypothetical protein
LHSEERRHTCFVCRHLSPAAEGSPFQGGPPGSKIDREEGATLESLGLRQGFLVEARPKHEAAQKLREALSGHDSKVHKSFSALHGTGSFLKPPSLRHVTCKECMWNNKFSTCNASEERSRTGNKDEKCKRCKDLKLECVVGPGQSVGALEGGAKAVELGLKFVGLFLGQHSSAIDEAAAGALLVRKVREFLERRKAAREREESKNAPRMPRVVSAVDKGVEFLSQLNKGNGGGGAAPK